MTKQDGNFGRVFCHKFIYHNEWFSLWVQRTETGIQIRLCNSQNAQMRNAVSRGTGKEITLRPPEIKLFIPLEHAEWLARAIHTYVGAR